ncbi:hypothetical protein AM588_10011473 [Phytophthora nicotianae]|uniref:RPN1 N-terminal domain-containing protein n=1 Tax=Phytophthora nicotianae TaxID=4792 RepID=A0A0W8DMZ3_PHYNI|nr:hypothetical protein AM588_10011473 [Phytophthora nicotianae]
MKETAQIPVPAKDPAAKDDKTPDAAKTANPTEDGPTEEELSEEDRKLKEDLETAVARVCGPQEEIGVKQLALELLRREIRTATSSMTSVPKPLKFLRPSYDDLKTAYATFQAGETKKLMADVLAVLAMTMAKEGSRESLKFKLLGNSTDLGSWGHEFVRSLAGEVGEEYNARITAENAVDPDVRDLLEIVDAIVPFHMQHNAEPEAIDILIEVQQLAKLLKSPDIDEKNYQRVCLYLLACADFMSDAEDLVNLLNTAYSLFLRLEQYPDALRVALRVGNDDFVTEVFQKCKDDVVRSQMGYILGRQRCFYEDESEASANEIIGNSDLSDKFLALARDLDVMEAKTPEDIYKSHLSETASVGRGRDSGSQPADSARANLASTFVNALVNAGYGTDKLMTPEGNTWLYKNKKHGMMSAAASLGMIMLWNVEEGITQIDKYLYSGDEYVKAGAILGVGVVSAGIRNDCDPALALLSEHIDSGNCSIRCASCLGLGIAYAGSAREDVSELLIPVVSHADENADIQEVSYAALALGMVENPVCAKTLLKRFVGARISNVLRFNGEEINSVDRQIGKQLFPKPSVSRLRSGEAPELNILLPSKARVKEVKDTKPSRSSPALHNAATSSVVSEIFNAASDIEKKTAALDQAWKGMLLSIVKETLQDIERRDSFMSGCLENL